MLHQQAMAKTPKKLFIKTFGCQMNAYDSERMAEALEDHGYETTEDLGAAIGSPLKKEVESTLKNYAIQKTASDKITIAPNTSKLVQLVEKEEPGSYLASFALKDGETLRAGGVLPFQVLVPLAALPAWPLTRPGPRLCKSDLGGGCNDADCGDPGSASLSG